MEINSSSFGLNPSSISQLYSIFARALSENNNMSQKPTATSYNRPTTMEQNSSLLKALESLIAEACKAKENTNWQPPSPASNDTSLSTYQTAFPLGLEGFKYTSNSNNNPHLIVPPATNQPYILAAIGTPPAAGELYLARTANLFNDTWKVEVKNAIEKNGGLGTANDGFLAFSKIGFVRLNNPNLNTEQNQRLAAISLQLGIPVEDLPSRSKSSTTNSDINNWIESFLNEHENKLKAFLENPLTGYSIKDGRHFYQMGIDAKTGIVTSSHQRLHGGIRGWCAENMQWLSPALDIVSKATSFIPGWGTVAAVTASGIKAVGNMISAGKFKASELWGFITDAATSFKLPVGKWGNQAIEWLVTKTGLESKGLKDIVKTCFQIDVDEILTRLNKIEEDSFKKDSAENSNGQEIDLTNNTDKIKKPYLTNEIKEPLENLVSALAN